MACVPPGCLILQTISHYTDCNSALPVNTRITPLSCLLLATFLVAGIGGMPAHSAGNTSKSGTGANAAVQSSPLSFKDTIQPFIEAHCVDCHGADTHKA